MGLESIYFSYLNKHSKIIAYEPDIETFKILQKNIKINKLKNIKAHNKALGDEIKKVIFYSYGNFDGSPGNTLTKKYINFSNVKKMEVQMTTLSSENIGKIDYLKLDIEAGEEKVMNDLSKNKLLKNIDIINPEYHYKQSNKENSLSKILNYLEEENFNYIINPDGIIGNRINLREYFEKDKSYVLIINCFKNE